MEICELKKGDGKINVRGIIVSKGEIKVFERFGKKFKVSSVELEDVSGKVLLTLWNDDIDKFKVGDQVKITNGYTNEFQGKLQLTAGKFGSIELCGNEGDGEEKNEGKQLEKEGIEVLEPKIKPEEPSIEVPKEKVPEPKKRGRPKKIPVDDVCL